MARSDSLLSDLTHVKLIAKEQHRRKRRLIKLNKSKRQQNFNNHYKYGSKYKKSKNNQQYYYYHHCYAYYDYQSDQIVNVNNNNNNNDQQYQVQMQDMQDIQYNKENNQTIWKTQQETDNDNVSISTHFESIECDYYLANCSKKKYLQFPSTFIYHITSLYESGSESLISSEQNDINGLLKSARSWNDNEYGQVVIIGTYLDELIKIFKENRNYILPMDIVYTISQLTGSAIIWLRKPGLNIFKWTLNYQLKERKFNINNEFFFSGYIGNDIIMKELLLLNNANNKYNQYLDLDWCFVAFLLLGLIPKYQNSYFKWYFNQKLLSALPPSFPFKYLS